MRIPVNSCRGCNANKPLTKSGTHIMGHNYILSCAFVNAELNDVEGELYRFYSARTHRPTAVKDANKINGVLLWAGQGPKEFWIVFRRTA